MRNFKNFLKEEEGMGVIEVVLIIIVLIGLAVTFKDKIEALANTLFGKMATEAGKFN